jgi:hypothetical protein
MKRTLMAAALALVSNVAHASDLSDAGWNNEKAARMYAIGVCATFNKQGMFGNPEDPGEADKWDECVSDMTSAGRDIANVGSQQMGMIIVEEDVRIKSSPKGRTGN